MPNLMDFVGCFCFSVLVFFLIFFFFFLEVSFQNSFGVFLGDFMHLLRDIIPLFFQEEILVRLRHIISHLKEFRTEKFFLLADYQQYIDPAFMPEQYG